MVPVVAQEYSSSLEHVLGELERIDLLIQAQVGRARQLYEKDREFLGLYISEQDVDALLQQPAGLPQWAAEKPQSSWEQVQSGLSQIASNIATRKEESTQKGISLRLDELRRLHLTAVDIDILLIALAPELDLRYERVYAYLQDDVTKKRPSVDLVLNLLCPSFEEKMAARQHFTVASPLLKHHLIQLFDDPAHQNPTLLHKFIKLDERITNYLLDIGEIDSRLLPYVKYQKPETCLEDLLLPIDTKNRLTRITKGACEKGEGLILYLQGPTGVGKQSTAQALCQELGKGLFVIDGERLISMEEARLEMAMRLITREAALQGAALYWSGFEVLLADDKRVGRETVFQELEHWKGLTFLAGDITWEPDCGLGQTLFIRIELPRPSDAERIRLWEKALNGTKTEGVKQDLPTLASKFRLTGGQIENAAATAKNMAQWRNPENCQIAIADVYEACRLHSNRKLVTLAQKITPHYSWEDIILPADRQQQLREICNYVKYRSLVYAEWGFDKKLSMGKGLNALFSGPSGTGKTMAAEIIAGELGLELYKIDLSSVVSKYIGETEKNLAKIFAEAETANGILFFDEADALFGRRSEVRDSHDRYANIETGYLLQKMEEYQGIVILATNLRKNIDEAFVRRMHFTIEFPFPAEKDRRRMWERIWPREIPRDKQLDLDVMATRYEMAGGNIRNVALAAAFLAASDGKIVRMDHLIQATRREYQKMGKVVVDGEFAGDSLAK